MAFEIQIKNKVHEIKFNYGLMFKVNKALGQADKDGNKSNNGAGVLFQRLLQEDDEAILDLVNIALKKEKFTDEDVIQAIEDYADEYGYEQLFEDVQQELKDSAFFARKIQKFIEQMEKVLPYMKSKEDEESQMQAKIIEEQIQEMKNALSSENVPESA